MVAAQQEEGEAISKMNLIEFDLVLVFKSSYGEECVVGNVQT